MFRLAIAACLLSGLAAAQNRPMALEQTRYEIRAGDPVRITAPRETIDFLLTAAKRNATPVNAGDGSFVIGPNRAGDQIMLAASLRTKPGEYAVQVSATSAAGEQRQKLMDIVVSPRLTVPSSATRPPVVLLNGWETGFTNACPISDDSTATFGNLAKYLVSDGVPVVYFFDNCREDPNQPIEVLANDLAAFLGTITYDNGAQVQQIDLVAHSIGGLIARAYLAGLQPDATLHPPANTLVRKLILIATPNFGSFLAANFANIIPTGTQSDELIPGSAFLWNLATWNQGIDDLRGVDAIAIIGNAGTYVNNQTNASLANASDGIISVTSASLGFVAQKASVTRIVPYCHVDPGTFTNTSLQPFSCNAPGIANVTSESHNTAQIVRSFLAGTSDWSSIGTTPATDIYLATNGGTFFSLLSSTAGYVTDVSQVVWGNLTLQTGGYRGTIFYDDFALGTGGFKVTSQSLGTVDCGNVTQAVGYFAAARCKINTAIISVGPLASAAGKVVDASSAITIKGAAFGSLCNGCSVVATPAGSTTRQNLSVSSWNNTSITAKLPAGLSGLVNITVNASTGRDGINILVASAAAPAMAVTPASMQFNSINGAAPDPQSIQLSNSGGGSLAWTATASDVWLKVSPASGTAPSTLTVSVDASSVSAGTYNGSIQISAAGAANTPSSIAVTLTVQGSQTAAPAITSVLNAGSFQPGFVSATWLTIFGANLAGTTYTWQASDFVNGQLPTSLQGVSVSINGKAAYVEYISATQINVLAPDDPTVGPVPVQVTVNQQQSNTLTAQLQPFAPAFFATGNEAVKPGDIIVLYGTGFGPTNPAVPTAQLVTAPAPLANPVQITIGGATASVAFAGLVQAGLYQFNVTVPAIPNGAAAVTASIGGVQTQNGVSITVKQ